MDDGVHSRGKLGTDHSDGGGRRRAVAGENCLRVRSAERRIARHHLVGDTAERIDVCPAIGLELPVRLLGAHVERGSHHQAGTGQALVHRWREILRDAEVCNQHLIPAQKQIARLDIAVDDARVVRVVERGGHLGDDAPHVVQRELRLALQARLERLPLDQGHHEVEECLGVTGIQEGEDTGVVQLGEEANLSQEPRGAEHLAVVPSQDLEGNRAVVGGIDAPVHEGHTPATDLGPHLVAWGNGALQLLAQLVGVVALAPNPSGILSA